MCHHKVTCRLGGVADPKSSTLPPRDDERYNTRQSRIRVRRIVDSPESYLALSLFDTAIGRGGMELLFSNQRSHKIDLPAATSTGDPATVHTLIHYLRDHLLKEREELFIEGDSVRPGILVLINDTDWELEGEGAYQLKSGDEVVFISTLHGG
ncbi:Ubiquitin- modifier 1 [Ceratobasidium sp. 392]|nr:Ubiquitin- modifier 1 [Ceratobasidium sp. 392]